MRFQFCIIILFYLPTENCFHLIGSSFIPNLLGQIRFCVFCCKMLGYRVNGCVDPDKLFLKPSFGLRKKSCLFFCVENVFPILLKTFYRVNWWLSLNEMGIVRSADENLYWVGIWGFIPYYVFTKLYWLLNTYFPAYFSKTLSEF